MKGILAAVDEPLVSIDFKATRTALGDLPFTSVLAREGRLSQGRHLYDNEWAIASARRIGQLLASKL